MRLQSNHYFSTKTLDILFQFLKLKFGFKTFWPTERPQPKNVAFLQFCFKFGSWYLHPTMNRCKRFLNYVRTPSSPKTYLLVLTVVAQKEFVREKQFTMKI